MSGEGEHTGWLLGPAKPLTPLLGSLGTTVSLSTVSHVKGTCNTQASVMQAGTTLPYSHTPPFTSSSSSACWMACPSSPCRNACTQRARPCCCPPRQVGGLRSAGLLAFEMEFSYTASAVPKPTIFLPLPPKCHNGSSAPQTQMCVCVPPMPVATPLDCLPRIHFYLHFPCPGAYRTSIPRLAFKAPSTPPAPAPPFPQEALTQALTWP